MERSERQGEVGSLFSHVKMLLTTLSRLFEGYADGRGKELLGEKLSFLTKKRSRTAQKEG